jgi:hypothetical protein
LLFNTLMTSNTCIIIMLSNCIKKGKVIDHITCVLSLLPLQLTNCKVACYVSQYGFFPEEPFLYLIDRLNYLVLVLIYAF